jgi:hypothetical protein
MIFFKFVSVFWKMRDDTKMTNGREGVEWSIDWGLLGVKTGQQFICGRAMDLLASIRISALLIALSIYNLVLHKNKVISSNSSD